MPELSPSCRRTAPLATILVVAAALVISELSAEELLIGGWLGRAEHNGQQGTMAIEFRDHPEHGLVASLSLPDLDAWDIGMVPVRRADGHLELGQAWELRSEPDGTLRGNLPGFLVPVYEIPIVFRRVDSLDKASPEPIRAPVARPVWRRDLGSPVWSGLEVAGGLLFVGDDAGHISALAAATGQLRWQIETGGAIRSALRVEAATLFAHSDDGFLYALDPATGSERWRAHLSPVERILLGAENSRYNHYASSVAIEDGVVYVGAFDGSLVALDLARGTEIWRFAAGETVAGTPAVAHGRLFFGSFNGKIFALDTASGKELWQFDSGGAVVSSPLVHDDLVIIGSRSYDLLALDAATGRRAWKIYYWYSWIESSVSERGGVGYVGASDSQDLLAVDLDSGRVLWRFDTRGSAWPKPAVSEAAVFIGTVGVADYWAGHQGALFAVERATGSPIWQFPQERPGEATTWGFAASPATDASFVYAADLDGRIYAFRQ